MSYVVRIRNNSTGEIRPWDSGLDYDPACHDGFIYHWTEGNFGCDCNRSNFFHRNDEHDYSDECGNDGYTVIDATLPDGTVIVIDEHDESTCAYC